MADGVFTPAISVTSAVGGIAVAKPSAAHDITAISIVGIPSQPISWTVINNLTGFLTCPVFRTTIWNAPFGFRLLPRYFFRDFYNAPSSDALTYIAAFIWFLILMGTGIYNITFAPGIFRAFDPSRAILRKLHFFSLNQL